MLNGGFTDCCILNTAFDAANYNYRVVVARDLVRGTDEHLEEAALAIVSLHLGLVADFSGHLRRMEGAQCRAERRLNPFAHRRPLERRQ